MQDNLKPTTHFIKQFVNIKKNWFMYVVKLWKIENSRDQ